MYCGRAWSSALLAIAMMIAVPAYAQDSGVHQVGRVIVTAPGWEETPPNPSPVPILVSLESTDPATQTLLHCDLSQAVLPPNPGWTQDTVNQRVRNDGEALLEQSPSLRVLGRSLDSTVVDVDGVAVANATAVSEGGEGPNYSNVRLFILVEPDSSGLYHSLICTLWGVANDANRARLDAVANSLRFDRNSQ